MPRVSGETARAERRALGTKAQLLPDLLTRMIYRAAGLSDEKAQSLPWHGEKRTGIFYDASLAICPPIEPGDAVPSIPRIK